MKKTRYLLLTTLTLLTLVSLWACKKSFFETGRTDGTIVESSSFTVKSDFDQALIGAYTPLQGQDAFGGGVQIKVPNAVMQDMIAGGDEKPFSGSLAAYMQGNADMQAYYRMYFQIAANSNVVISKLADVQPGVLTEAENNLIRGQAKFLRGYAYFNLARAFGDVPMPLAIYEPSQNTLPCTKKADIFKQVIADLMDAEANLPEANVYGSGDRGRVTRGAALAYLANTYMYTEEWAKAKIETDKLMALTKPKYALAADPQTPFSIKNKNTPEYIAENIFEIQGRDGSDRQFQWGGTPNTGTLVPVFTTPGVGAKFTPVSNGGWGEWIINKKAVESFEPGDKRLTKMIVKHGGTNYRGEFFTEDMTADAWKNNQKFNSAWTTKYWLGPAPTAVPGGASFLSHQYLPQMRFAEVLLNYAEIQFKLGNLTGPEGAYEYLNKVRRRAGLPEILTSANFIATLMNERRHELVMEPNLWWHYTRTGTAKAFLKNEHGVDMEDRWVHFPIPGREKAFNPNICSNGY
ncbi:MAG TPA: RagB/SusD family nutrient uptake outer membrane protein [Pedobacter sp.]|jgi:hypothetical protein